MDIEQMKLLFNLTNDQVKLAEEFSFTEQQLEDLRAAINVALSTFENSTIDPNKALQNRLIKIRENRLYD